jgi:hypothetical protein
MVTICSSHEQKKTESSGSRGKTTIVSLVCTAAQSRNSTTLYIRIEEKRPFGSPADHEDLGEHFHGFRLKFRALELVYTQDYTKFST